MAERPEVIEWNIRQIEIRIVIGWAYRLGLCIFKGLGSGVLRWILQFSKHTILEVFILIN